MSYTRSDWSRDLLYVLGNHNPNMDTIRWVVAWTVLETKAPGIQYNLLNTKHKMPGSWDAKNGVQGFLTYLDGLQANCNALNDGYYPYLSFALLSDDTAALGFPDGTISNFIQHELSIWCGGCDYGQKLFSHLDLGFTEPFTGFRTLWKELQAKSIFFSTQVMLKTCYNGYTPDYGNKISLKWRQVSLNGKKPGPPLTPVYNSIDWSNNNVRAQDFGCCHAEELNDIVALYDVDGNRLV